MPHDVALIEEVMAALTERGHFDLRRVPIAVTAHGGVVELRGRVETLREKRRAGLIARGVPGVHELRSELRIAPVMPKTDGEIANLARDALEADRNVDATGIDVTVHNGVVTLRGIVGTRMQQRLAVATIWWLTGVQDVRDELAVLYPEEDSDDELEDACHVMLDKDPLVDEAGVSVLAEDGVITLAGAVGSAVERDAAENTVWGIEGVRDVRNHLLVVPGSLPTGQRELGT